MTVLVTRPGTSGVALYQQLTANGYTAIHHPLINICASNEIFHFIHNLHRYDMVIAVSQHAVTFSQQMLLEHHVTWPSHCRYFAIGQKTAHFLSKATQQKVHYPDISNSEQFLALPELQNVSGLTVAILRGNGGRDLIYDKLVQRGAIVTYQEVYTREYLPFSSHKQILYWQKQQINRIIITSSEQMFFLVSQLNDQEKAWLFDLHLFVPSERITQDALHLGFKHITNTNSASNMELVAAIHQQTGL